MSDIRQQRVRRTVEHLVVRTTTSHRSTATISQPTDAIPLTAAFTPPSSCFENILTMLPSPGYQIWLNEPVPLENHTVAACYPTEFLESYTPVVVSFTTSAVVTSTTSSVVPAMSPFVCPKNYCTMFAEARNYIACCPSGYQLHLPDTKVDSDRPAYGGTCYSDLPPNTNIPVIAYDETGNTASQAFSTSASGAQAFARPIDGWALTSPSIVGCPTSSSSFAASDQSANPSSTATSDSGISTGVIVGASIGGFAGLALVIGLVWFLLAYRRKAKNAMRQENANEIDANHDGKTYYSAEAPTGYFTSEMSASPEYQRVEAPEGWRNSGKIHGTFEMHADSAAELPVNEKQSADVKAMQYHAN